MLHHFHVVPKRVRFQVILILGVALLHGINAAAQTNFPLRVAAANLPGNPQKYEAAQIRILQGLKPDVVAIQEFNYLGNSPSELRSFVDTAFGTNFVYYRESGYSIPNGVISRWPILSSGSWPDSVVPNRGFAWAQIDLPGSNDLYVVSVHLYSSGSATDRNLEATIIKNHVQSNFPANAWVIVAGDMNTGSRSESAITTFKTFLSDSPIPTDAVSGGDDDTNLGRNKPYDYVLPSFSMTNTLTNVVFASHTFAKGLVFDSRVYTPLSDVTPVQIDDSSECQHMAVVKDFHVNDGGTIPPGNTPQITDQPDGITVTEGDNATFSVTATGAAPLIYQWRFDNTTISGATNSSYTRFNAQTGDAGGYRVVITNSAGNLTSVVALLTVSPPGGGSGDVIAQWDFNSVPPDAATSTGTLLPSIGSGTVSVVGGITQTFFSGNGSTDPATSDDSALGTVDYPAQSTGNKTAGVQFQVNTSGREQISVAWDVRPSGSGSKYARLQYTTNGTTFLDFPTATINTTSFGRHTNDLSILMGVDDNSAFAFRIVSEFENTATGSGTAGYVGVSSTYGSGGTLRYDRVTVHGSTIVLPPAPPLLGDPSYTENLFQFEVTGQTGKSYVIETTTNLAAPNWMSVKTNVAPFGFAESNNTGAPLRFYRGRSQP